MLLRVGGFPQEHALNAVRLEFPEQTFRADSAIRMLTPVGPCHRKMGICYGNRTISGRSFRQRMASPEFPEPQRNSRGIKWLGGERGWTRTSDPCLKRRCC